MINKEKYSHLTRKELFYELISNILKTSEQIESEIEEEEILVEEEEIEEEISPKGRPTDLKIYFLKDESGVLSPLGIQDRLIELQTRWTSDLIQKWNMDTYKTSDKNLFVLEAVQKRYEREKKFYIILNEKFWQIYTVEDDDTCGKTIKRIIDYIPELIRIWVLPTELEDITNEVFTSKGINGFVSKYRPVAEEKKVTIQVYGGDESDLEKAREHFQTEPSLIRFKMSGSPFIVSTGSVSQGRLNIGSILHNFESKFYEIIDNTTKSFFERDKKLFENIKGYTERTYKDENGNIVGRSPSVFSALILKVKELKKKTVSQEKIEERLLKAFLEKIKEYICLNYDSANLNILDSETGESFQVKFEDWQFVIYPHETTHAKTIRKACRYITELVEPSCYEPKLIYEELK